MHLADVAAADLVAYDALQGALPQLGETFEQRARRGQSRVAHLLETDPGGAWVAESAEGRVVGVALALLREGLWGLSLLAVEPALQGNGIGRRLLDAALSYADAARGAIILSSTDPKAMRRYARAGFALRPAVAAAGIVGGAELLVLGDRGFVVHCEGTPRLLAALDEEAAQALLRAALAASSPGATVQVDFISAGQDWAVAVALEAGLALSPDGPIFVRGDVGPLRHHLPSGAYL